MEAPGHIERAEGARLPRRVGELEPRSLRPPFGTLGRWPRADALTARQALDTAAAALGPWAALAWEERVDVLRRAAARLESRGELSEALAPFLGLEPWELAPRLEEQLFRFRESLELLSPGAPGEGPGVFQAHWSDMLGGLGARLAVRLARGETAVLLTSPRLPLAGELLEQALVEAGLPRGAVAVLHDDTRTALEALVSRPGPGWVRLRGTEDAIEALRARHEGAFGAGLARWSCWPIRNSTLAVLRGDEPADAAERIVERAVSRSGTLSGQLPGQVGRVVCHQRLFSRLSEELLTRLETCADAARPVPLIDPDLHDHAKALWSLGLDEGATPIFGSEPSRPGPRAHRAAAQVGPAGGGEEAQARLREPPTLRPILFTNVDPRQRLAAQRRPCPVLALVRAGSDEEAGELRARLDA